MRPALDDGSRCFGALQLDAALAEAASLLRQAGTRVLATLLDNGAAFVALDEAALRLGLVHVPLPLFFSAAQLQHALRAAGVDTLLLGGPAESWRALLPGHAGRPVQVAGTPLWCVPLSPAPPALPPHTAKISFTSGTTGAPKGVCLGAAALLRVAQGLVEATAPLGIERHLCALPFAVLLENIAGWMAPRLRGATVVAPPLRELGLAGSSSFDAAVFQAAVQRHRPHSLILLPQMLRAWCDELARSGQRAPASLKLVAVGGAAVGAALIGRAQALGIPACEGYGLSEGASVQTLNLPGLERPGSAGRPLPHARLKIAGDGEILIQGSLFCGYLGERTPPPDWWPSGDLGRIDADGYLHVHGRKKNLLITGYGRNVSPEWVEAALREQPALAQAVVFGDGQPALSAVLWAAQPQADAVTLQAAVDAANATLPDYARIARWTRARAAFDAGSGLATANGRPQRDAILRRHADALGLPCADLSPA